MEFKVPALPVRTSQQLRTSTQSSSSAPSSAPTPAPSFPPEPPQPRSSSALSYTPPIWSSVALHPYSFSVLRQGVELSSISLTSHPYLTVGRLPSPHCHLSLSHPSISRYHAVVQHRDDGRLFLFDLHSSHGTFLNKRRVPSQQFIELHVGDQVRFGDSERIYLLEGPDELRTPEGEVRRKGRLPPSAQPRMQGEVKKEAEGEERERNGEDEKKGGEHEEDFVSWGMADDAPGDDEDAVDSSGASGLYQRVSQYLLGSSPSLSSGDLAALNEAQRAIVQRVERKRQKALHMAEEVDTLMGKESKQGSLTDGQRAQMEKNEKRIEDIQANIMEDVEALRDAMQQHSQTSLHPTRRGQRGGRDEEGGDDSDDDFFDRTLNKKREAPAPAAVLQVGSAVVSAVNPLSSLLPVSSLMTASAVGAQLRRCEELRDSLRVVLRDLTSSADAVSAVDSLDAFMGRVDSQRRAEKREKVKGDLRALQSHYERLKGRLREKEAEERVQKLRQLEDTAVVSRVEHAKEERKAEDGRLHGEEATASAHPVGSALQNGGSEVKAAADGGGGGGGLSDALERLRRTQPSTTAVAVVKTAKPSANIGPAVRPSDHPPTDLIDHSPSSTSASAASLTTSSSSSSSSLSDLARRMDAARASAVHNRGDSSITSAMKRRMEGSSEKADGETDGGGGGLMAWKKRRGVEERDRGEVDEESSASADADLDVEWRPPVSQTGDGRTHLNARLGY